jgi:3-oxoacyl-[acyl-carrier-protein] synthase III
MGHYFPERAHSTTELMDRMARPGLLDLEEMTGITSRRVRDRSEGSYALALKAAEDCLARSKYDPAELDAVIFVSISRFDGELRADWDPAISLRLKRGLGATRALHMDISNACAGMCTGAFLLDRMIRSGEVKNGLVVSGECITPIMETALAEITHADDEQFASLTVGDSGAACILEACEPDRAGIDFMRFLTIGEFSELCMGLPSDQRAGVAMYTKSAKMQVATIKVLPRLLELVAESEGVNVDDYDVVVPHQTSAHAIEMGALAFRKYFRREMPRFLSVVAEYGNTSSTSHFVALRKAILDGEIQQGDRVLFMVMASGLVLGFVSFTVDFLEANHARKDLPSRRLRPARAQHVD